MDHIKRERIIDLSIFVAALLLRFYVLPRHIEITEEYALASLSPAFFPKLAVWFIAGLAALHLILTFTGGSSPAPEEDGEERLSRKEEYKAYLSSLLIVAYFFSMKYFGFLPSTIIVLGVLFVIQGVKGPIKVILTSVMVTIGVYVFFLYIMQVHFPRGLFFE